MLTVYLEGTTVTLCVEKKIVWRGELGEWSKAIARLGINNKASREKFIGVDSTIPKP